MASEQRSFRLSSRTLELLDRSAARTGESRNAVADRLLQEALRTEQHPLIRFHYGPAGRRQPMLVRTRLYIHQVIASVRAEDGDIEAAAEYLGVSSQLVRAALDYYAQFRDDVDADAEACLAAEVEERDRWERQQRALA